MFYTRWYESSSNEAVLAGSNLMIHRTIATMSVSWHQDFICQECTARILATVSFFFSVSDEYVVFDENKNKIKCLKKPSIILELLHTTIKIVYVFYTEFTNDKYKVFQINLFPR